VGRAGGPPAVPRGGRPFWDHVRVPADVEVFRPASGRALAVVVAVLAAGGLVSGLASDAAATWPWAAPVGVVVVLVWAAYWRPAVVVTPAGVELRNVTRTVELPWPAVEEVGTRYALTLRTAYGEYAAWAAPAPGRARVRASGPGDVDHLPAAAPGARGVRPGDLASSASGQAAAAVRGRWEQLRAAGVLDDPRLERARPRVRWHAGTLAVVVVLAAASALGLTR
jgi:hypothetical protein